MAEEERGARPPAGEEPPRTEDMEGGLRFMHAMGMQTRLSVAQQEARTTALLEELIASGVIDLRAFEARLARVSERPVAPDPIERMVFVGETVDKYGLVDLPRIDCAARLHLCRARCCKLQFPLTFQDLDEGVVRWRYEQPYVIRQREDGYCVHNCAETLRCEVHASRPATCRVYDCRRDKRIWIDFEGRIPVPEDTPVGKVPSLPEEP